jgi:hypothetical protein
MKTKFKLIEVAERSLCTSLEPGNLVRLVFDISGAKAEFMWVYIRSQEADGTYIGQLDDEQSDFLLIDNTIRFRPEHIVSIWKER